GFITENTDTSLKYVDEKDLSINTQYIDRYVTAINGVSESASSTTASCFTLANTPLELIVSDITSDSLNLKINLGDNNPPNTEYAIKELNSGEYIKPDGTFSLTENWQTYENWGKENGVVVNGEPLPTPEQPINENINTNVNAQFKASLLSGTTYNFAVKARNGDGIETAFSGTTSGVPPVLPTGQPNIVASKGVGINLALSSGLKFGLIKIVQAYDELILKQTTINERLLLFLEEFALFLVLILVLLIILLVIGLHSALKHLREKDSFINKLKLIWHILSKEPAFVFIANAQKDPNGTYQISYEKHKRFHVFSQKNFKRILGLIIIDLLLLSYLAIYLNHNSKAQNILYNQSGLEVSVNDKLSYIIEFANQGNAAATNVAVTDNLNSGLDYVLGSAKIVINNQTITQGITVNGKNISINVGDLGANQNGAIYLAATINDSAEGSTIFNQAQISGANFSSILTNTTNNKVKTAVPPLNVPPVVPPPFTPPPVTPPPVTPPPVTPPPVTPPPVAPPPIVTPPAQAVTPIGIVNAVKQDFFDNPQVEQVIQNIITPVLLTIAALNTIPSALILAINVLPYLHLIFIEPFLLLFRKKRKKWGVVYDALTKLPVSLAVVRLYSKKDNKLIQTKVTDKSGRYLLIVKDPGFYYLSVTKPEYKYPSAYLRNEKEDTRYLDLYHGEEIEVKEKEGILTANIPLDPLEKRALTEKEAVRSYIIKNSRLMVSYAGIILSLLVILIYPTLITIGALVLHIIMFLLFRKLIVPPKPKSWGIVSDEQTKQP
ncbi:MAG: hypothetical protein NT116_04470, partial [Candidatus Parcubacteria bacterium]|nr:hypothetical protein [Candidatus Parcubacteria bacterium]